MNDPRLTEMWKRQPLEAPVFTLDALQSAARTLRGAIRRRNRIEYAAGALVIAGNAFDLWLFGDLLTRIGTVLVILGTLFVSYQLHRRASAQPPAERVALPAAVFYRAELVRQRDALRSVFFWYLLPLFPGIEIFFLGRQLQTSAPMNLWIFLLFPALAVAVVWLNLHAARKLQRRIDALDIENNGEN